MNISVDSTYMYCPSDLRDEPARFFYTVVFVVISCMLIAAVIRRINFKIDIIFAVCGKLNLKFNKVLFFTG